jgi:predicted RND superfamily exporter protein
VVSRADVVVWADERPLPQAELETASAVVDATQIFQSAIEHELVGDKIPQATGAEGLQVVYTGVVPVVYKAQRTLLGSLVDSIGLAFVLIGVVMIVLLNPSKSPLRFWLPRNLPFGTLAGAVSMIPNMFPVLLVFGLMGHFGRLVDIGTMMTASVAMGVAVDDTIHFLSWFRTYLDRGYDRIKAIEMTYRRVGPAMTQTTIVGGLGLFVFALSTFTPTQRFGSLMLILLAAALIGDLILLPALLAGPLGRFFKPRENARLRPDVGDDSRLPDEDDRDGEAIDKEGLPHLKLHSPSRRTDQPHRMKGR